MRIVSVGNRSLWISCVEFPPHSPWNLTRNFVGMKIEMGGGDGEEDKESHPYPCPHPVDITIKDCLETNFIYDGPIKYQIQTWKTN